MIPPPKMPLAVAAQTEIDSKLIGRKDSIALLGGLLEKSAKKFVAALW
jgi:hypothetical protein